MILNENYYRKLFEKYLIQKGSNVVADITVAALMNTYKERNVYFNFPKGYDLKVIINLLYENFAKHIFSHFADITDYSIGDKFKNNRKKGKDIYEIVDIRDRMYYLTNIKEVNYNRIETSFSKLKKNYTQIKQSTRTTTIQAFINYFKTVNDYGFTPQYFSKKFVLIAGQNTWNNLKNKNCIPTTYLPNTRDGEQTTRHSIEAFEDCIAYITPKYAVCYEELFLKGVEIDTLIVCDTDLSSISQIISDKTKYKFNLIILSNESIISKTNGITLWNWQKEEIELLENKNGNKNKIDIDCVEDIEFDNHIQHFEECMKYVSELEYPIKLKSYGYFLRLALNAIQEEQFDYLLMRLKSNKELERNEGGYEDFGKNNPKEALIKILLYLKSNNPKHEALLNTMSKISKKTLIVVDRENFELFMTDKNNNYKIVTNAELKSLLKNDKTYIKTIVFNSFNGSKDFDFIYNLSNNIRLVLHGQEKNLYFKQLQNHKKQLEEELTSTERFSICGIKYEPIVKEEVKVSPTLEQIIERLEQRSNTAYEGYKDESDSLLDDLEEEITYEVTMSNGETWNMESNETVFDHKGNLVKPYRLKINNKIRIYPKEQLAENLFQIAVDVEPDKFGKINEHSDIWKNQLKALDKQLNNRDLLYQKLKEQGLRVLPLTVDSYFRGYRKFPMFNSDLKAILSLANKENLLPEIKKSKRLYNSTMIALGRGVKQELQQFLQNKTVGDILQKKNFTVEALQQFINEYMPLLTITKIEEINDEQQ